MREDHHASHTRPSKSSRKQTQKKAKRNFIKSKQVDNNCFKLRPRATKEREKIRERRERQRERERERERDRERGERPERDSKKVQIKIT